MTYNKEVVGSMNYKELFELNNEVETNIDLLEKEVENKFSTLVSDLGFKNRLRVIFSFSSDLLRFEFSNSDERFDRDVIYVVSYADGYDLFSKDIPLNYKLETEISYSGSRRSGKELDSQTDFFIETYSTIKSLNHLIKDSDSDLAHYLVNKRLEMYELKRMSSFIESCIKNLVNEEKQKLKEKLLNENSLERVNFNDIYSVIRSGDSDLNVKKVEVQFNEDKLFSDPDNSVNLEFNEMEIFKSGSKYKIFEEGCHFNNRQEYLKRELEEFFNNNFLILN